MEMQDAYQVFDSCYATITCCSRKGAYLLLDNGEQAFAFGSANLRPGTAVLCSIMKRAKPDTGKLMLVSVDSVMYPSALAA